MKIISGGQTGVDRAALEIAKELGLETGGYMPRNFRAQDGQHPEFANLYNIIENKHPGYPARTALNVRESDATLRIAMYFDSPGEKLTMKMIEQYNRPHYDVNVLDENTTPIMVAEWLKEHVLVKKNFGDFIYCGTLNVAGNSEKTCPGIGEFAKAFLENVIIWLKNDGTI